MRRLWMLYLTLGLVASQGCHHTCQHTCGVCDCNPPPVESLLVAPCPSSSHDPVVPVHGPYAPAPYAAMPAAGNPAAQPTSPILGGPAKPAVEKPANDKDKPEADKPAGPTGGNEPIRSLPKIIEAPK